VDQGFSIHWFFLLLVFGKYGSLIFVIPVVKV